MKTNNERILKIQRLTYKKHFSPVNKGLIVRGTKRKNNIASGHDRRKRSHVAHRKCTTNRQKQKNKPTLKGIIKP